MTTEETKRRCNAMLDWLRSIANKDTEKLISGKPFWEVRVDRTLLDVAAEAEALSVWTVSELTYAYQRLMERRLLVRNTASTRITAPWWVATEGIYPQGRM